MKRCVAAAIASFTSLIAFTASSVLAQQFTVVDLGTLGGSTSQANAISEGGIIAGYATTALSVKHAVIWDDTGIVDLGAPAPFVVSEALAVNDSRQVACNAEGNPQTVQAYLWENGVFTPLGTLLGRGEAIAQDIDASGRIVGTSLTFGAGDDRGFIWEDGVMSDLGTLGGTSAAFAINNVGQVVGRSEAATGFRAFIWQDGAISDLGVLSGETFSQANDINDAGHAAGTSWTLVGSFFLAANQASLWREEIIDLGLTPGPDTCSSGFFFYTDNIARGINSNEHVVGHAQCVSSGGPLAAFLWRDGVMHNLNNLIPIGSGWDLISANDINDRGQIVGFGIAPSGELHGFLLNPLCIGDIDGDNDTDVFDFGAFAASFGQSVTPGTGGDLDGDGDIDVFDFGIFAGDFGCSGP